MDVTRPPYPLWVPESEAEATPEKRSPGQTLIAYLKLLAIMGLILDVMFHWLESTTWQGSIAFLFDGFEVENTLLHAPGFFQGMQFVALLAHSLFAVGLIMLLLTPLRLGPGHSLGGIGQIKDLPMKGKHGWWGKLAIAVCGALIVLVLALSLKGTGLV